MASKAQTAHMCLPAILGKTPSSWILGRSPGFSSPPGRDRSRLGIPVGLCHRLRVPLVEALASEESSVDHYGGDVVIDLGFGAVLLGVCQHPIYVVDAVTWS